MEQSLLLAIIAGYSAGVVGGYLLSKRIIVWLSRGRRKPRLVALLGSVGGLAALFPAFFLSTFIEGNPVGGYWQEGPQIPGLGSFDLPIRLGLGLALSIAAITSSGALAGAAIARLIASRQRPRRTI
jgi:NAD/NADP transhydrogenase beta subunit